MIALWMSLALAAPAPATPITAAELVGRWQRVGHPEDCAAGAHEFVATGSSERVVYRNPVGRFGPAQGKVDGLPDAGYGAALELAKGEDWRAFQLVRSWPKATGELVVVPITPTAEEKRSKDAFYDLVRCPAAPAAAPAAVAESAVPLNDLSWLEGSWGETGPGFARAEGWFAARCDRVFTVPEGVVIPDRVSGNVKVWPNSRVAHGAFLIWTTDSGGLAAVQSVWGADEMLGAASLVDLAPEVAHGSVWIRSKDGERMKVAVRDPDHIALVAMRDNFPVPTLFERCPPP